MKLKLVVTSLALFGISLAIVPVAKAAITVYPDACVKVTSHTIYTGSPFPLTFNVTTTGICKGVGVKTSLKCVSKDSTKWTNGVLLTKSGTSTAVCPKSYTAKEGGYTITENGAKVDFNLVWGKLL